MVVVSLEKEKERKNQLVEEEIVKKLKKKEKSQFLQNFCKISLEKNVVTTLNNMEEVDKNVQECCSS